MRSKSTHGSRLLSATDEDDASTTIPLTCHEYGKNGLNTCNETQKL